VRGFHPRNLDWPECGLVVEIYTAILPVRLQKDLTTPGKVV